MPSLIARKLRGNLTDAERRLWYRLRRRQCAGFRFRRQVPLGAYIVDFACLSEKLVVEIDGGQHADNADRDAVRTTWLERNGFQVIRFWNNEVLRNTDGVVEEIERKLQEKATAQTPHSNLPPQGGRDNLGGSEGNSPPP